MLMIARPRPRAIRNQQNSVIARSCFAWASTSPMMVGCDSVGAGMGGVASSVGIGVSLRGLHLWRSSAEIRPMTLIIPARLRRRDLLGQLSLQIFRLLFFLGQRGLDLPNLTLQVEIPGLPIQH